MLYVREIIAYVCVLGHMAQLGKKNLNLFRTLRREQVEKAKNAGNTEVPNLQESLVDVHVHNGSKRKASVLVMHGVGRS